MSRRRFPHSPEPLPRPFDGERNSFADDVTTSFASSTNPLETSTVDEVQPFKPAEYVVSLPGRSQRILFCGVAGALFVGASLLILVMVLATSPWLSVEMVYTWPTDLLGLALCLPALMMGRSDLRAIRAGAMDAAGIRRTRIGFWCGFLGTLFGAVPFLLAVISIVLATVN